MDMEPLLSGLEDRLIEWHHVFNVNRNIRPWLLVQAMFNNQAPHPLHIGASLSPCIHGMPSASASGEQTVRTASAISSLISCLVTLW